MTFRWFIETSFKIFIVELSLRRKTRALAFAYGSLPASFHVGMKAWIALCIFEEFSIAVLVSLKIALFTLSFTDTVIPNASITKDTTWTRILPCPKKSIVSTWAEVIISIPGRKTLPSLVNSTQYFPVGLFVISTPNLETRSDFSISWTLSLG